MLVKQYLHTTMVHASKKLLGASFEGFRLLVTLMMQRYLFMKLTYHEDTPDEYEPPHFKPITEEGLGHFARKPFSM